LDALAACAALFYTLTSFRAAETLQFIALASAGMANFVCLMHTLTAIVRRRGVFTPAQKWGPLSFMKLTHEAFRGNMSTLRKSLDVLDLKNKNPSDLNLFAAHLNRFNILHDEHSKHEDEVIFKTFNDWFHDHAKKFNSDHEHYHETMHQMEAKANVLLDNSLSVDDRQAALDWIKKTMPAFFDEFEEHLRGEELDLQPIGRKYLPLEIQKQISRKVFEITPAEKWEIIIPYVINNLPRHLQRVRYLKVLLWSMPERGQQIGSIVYRNVDAVMWERLRVEVPEIIPRTTYNWKRYY
jgi:hemerythrin-like domain-containing protein